MVAFNLFPVFTIFPYIMADFVVGVQAYCKLFLHAMKYPHCAVNGVLLAKDSQPKDKIIHFVDCIPLFHLALGLSPMLEIALLQVNEYCCILYSLRLFSFKVL